jgi:hypothetical protein
MAEALERDLGGHRDRRRVQEVGDLRARDRAAEQHVAPAVDDEARRAGRAGSVEQAAQVAGGLGVIDVELDPGTGGGLGGVPDASDLRSVKITCGA